MLMLGAMGRKCLNMTLSGWFALLLFQAAPCFSYQFEAPPGNAANADSQEMQRKRAELLRREAELKRRETELRRRESKVEALDSRTPQKPQVEDELAAMRKQLEQLKAEAASAAERAQQTLKAERAALEAERDRVQAAQRAPVVPSPPARVTSPQAESPVLLAPVTKPVPPEKSTEYANKPFKDCDVCPEMIAVPSGDFSMTMAARVEAKPMAHRVSVRTFAMGRFEVTAGQWDSCVRDKHCRKLGDVSLFNRNLPVTSVGWGDVRLYLAWLSNKSGYGYRLPTEAEWEYVAVEGQLELDNAKANAGGCVGLSCSQQSGLVKEDFRPNRFGIYNLITGSVWEWVDPCFSLGGEGVATKQLLRSVECEAGVRLLRGGSWQSSTPQSRSHERKLLNSDGIQGDFGVRVARDL